MSDNKKSQSALEFLTTYGWAFLIILIMIGALAYFGILSPNRLLPNRCNFGAEFGCSDYQASATGSQVKLRLKNNLGQPITIANVGVGTDSTTSLFCSAAVAPLPPISNIRSGQLTDITFSTCGFAAAGVAQGEKTKLNVTVDFYPSVSGANYQKSVKGEMYTTVV